jgi:hypothetical protein
MRDVAADEDRQQPTRFVAPQLVLAIYAIRVDIGDQHRRSFSDEGRASVGPVEAEHPDQPHMSFVGRQDLQIADQVARGRMAALQTPSLKRTNLLRSIVSLKNQGDNAT